MKNLFTLLLAGVLLVGCEPAKTDQSESMSFGERTMKTYCFACHNPRTPDAGKLIAPPLVAVKYYYQEKYPDKDEFIKAMSAYIHKPDESLSINKNWITRFDLMPETFLTDEEVNSIVEHIFNNPIEEPEWFPAHFEENHGKPWVNE